MLIAPISLVFCGHLGDKIQLDGAALGISVSRMSGTCNIVGLYYINRAIRIELN